MIRPILLTCLLAAAVPLTAHPFEPEADADRLYAVTHRDSSLWDRVAEFCDQYPRRLSGTPVLEEGIDWIIARMRQDGWSVRTQPVSVPTWVRGKESLRMLTKPMHLLPMLGLGGSVGTDGGPLRAEVLVVRSFEHLDSIADQAEGKIVVWNVPFTTYGETVRYRYDGPSAAARHGAVASLVRSVGPFGMQTPHTGGMGYREDVPRIPAAAINMEDANLLQRQQ